MHNAMSHETKYWKLNIELSITMHTSERGREKDREGENRSV